MKSIKRYKYLLPSFGRSWGWGLFFLLLISCGPQKGRIRIKGEFENLPQADLLIYSPDGGLSTVDTLHIQKGRFDYTAPVPESPDPYTFVIVYPNYHTLTFQAHTSSVLRIHGDALSLSQVQVEGADSVLPERPRLGRQPMKVGRRLPKHKLLRHDSDKWLLLGFWASWKHGSSNVNYFVDQALREHPDSLQALTYSLDVDPAALASFSASYGASMPSPASPDSSSTHFLGKAKGHGDRWHTYCDYTGWSGILLSKLGVRNIPLFVLVNPGDTVVAIGSNYSRDIKPHFGK